MQPTLGPETSCCFIYGLFSANDVSLADLANAILLACFAEEAAIHRFTRRHTRLLRTLRSPQRPPTADIPALVCVRYAGAQI